MLSRIRDKILQTGKAYGLEVSLLADGAMLIQLVSLKLGKNKIIKEREVSSIPTIEDLKKYISSGVPVAVVVNGKGILHKKVPLEAVTDSLFESILPNGNPAEFYLQVCRYANFASAYLVRKAILDKLINDLLYQKFRILSVTIGAMDLPYLMPYVNFEKDTTEIKTNHFLLRMQPQGTISDIEAAPFFADEARPAIEYSIGNYYVFPKGIMAFSAAMGLLAGSMMNPPDIINPRIFSEREEYKYYKYFKVASWAFLGLLFGVLLVNFFVYNHYYSRNEQQQVSAALMQAEANQIEKIQSALSSKEQFINQYGWGHPSKISLYADRIAALVPDDAQLTALRINPAHTIVSGDGGPSLFQEDTIQLTGTCENPAGLNRFANNLRNIRDFREIDIKSYLYKKEARTGVFVMEIITL